MKFSLLILALLSNKAAALKVRQLSASKQPTVTTEQQLEMLQPTQDVKVSRKSPVSKEDIEKERKKEEDWEKKHTSNVKQPAQSVTLIRADLDDESSDEEE